MVPILPFFPKQLVGIHRRIVILDKGTWDPGRVTRVHAAFARRMGRTHALSASLTAPIPFTATSLTTLHALTMLT